MLMIHFPVFPSSLFPVSPDSGSQVCQNDVLVIFFFFPGKFPPLKYSTGAFSARADSKGAGSCLRILGGTFPFPGTCQPAVVG